MAWCRLTGPSRGQPSPYQARDGPSLDQMGNVSGDNHWHIVGLQFRFADSAGV